MDVHGNKVLSGAASVVRHRVMFRHSVTLRHSRQKYLQAQRARSQASAAPGHLLEHCSQAGKVFSPAVMQVCKTHIQGL